MPKKDARTEAQARLEAWCKARGLVLVKVTARRFRVVKLGFATKLRVYSPGAGLEPAWYGYLTSTWESPVLAWEPLQAWMRENMDTLPDDMAEAA